jgi:hypothetical protein
VVATNPNEDAGIIAAGARVESVVAAQSPAPDQDTKQKEKKLAAGEAEARRLLLLMDRDKRCPPLTGLTS